MILECKGTCVPVSSPFKSQGGRAPVMQPRSGVPGFKTSHGAETALTCSSWFRKSEKNGEQYVDIRINVSMASTECLDGTRRNSANIFFHLFIQRCTSGTNAALGPISSWYISSNLSKSWAVFGEAYLFQYLGIKPQRLRHFCFWSKNLSSISTIE